VDDSVVLEIVISGYRFRNPTLEIRFPDIYLIVKASPVRSLQVSDNSSQI